jgi:transcriptional regulator with XRE-family HTH domain
MTISREQCRAARGLLNWSQPDLAKVLGVARSTIAHFERGASKPYARTLAAIRATLETAGIIFIEGDDKVGPGVQLRDPREK